jgi:hypothetical protein
MKSEMWNVSNNGVAKIHLRIQSVPQREQPIYVTKINLLMLFKKIIPV